jgi:hypothetical protein
LFVWLLVGWGGIAESGALQGVLENCACEQVKVFFWERVLLVLLLLFIERKE